MQRFVLIGSGQDKPGLVAGLTGLLGQYQGNIEDSSMTRLAGQFATLLITSFPDDVDVSAFEAACKRLKEELGFSLNCKRLEADEAVKAATRQTVPYMITVAGNDRTGITHAIAVALASLQANITDLNAHQIAGEEGSVYLMVIEADVPAPMTLSALQAHLKPLSEAMNLDVRVRAIDALTFQL